MERLEPGWELIQKKKEQFATKLAQMSIAACTDTGEIIAHPDLPWLENREAA